MQRCVSTLRQFNKQHVAWVKRPLIKGTLSTTASKISTRNVFSANIAGALATHTPVTSSGSWASALVGAVGLSVAASVLGTCDAHAEGESDQHEKPTDDTSAKLKTAYDGGWWRFRSDGRRRHPSEKTPVEVPRPDVVEPASKTQTIRVACVGDSIMYGFDAGSAQPTKISMPGALEQISALSGKKVSSKSVETMCVDTVLETERLWNVLDMPLFLLGGDHPEGPHHGLDIGNQAGYTADSKSPPMKQKLALMAQRLDVDLGWGWPWPGSEVMPVALATTVPQHLQHLLGDEFSCENFGVSGVTLLADAHNPYVQRPQFVAALAFKPHVVVINLGYNDANKWNWDLHSTSFVKDYLNLIDEFKELETKPKVYICLPTLPHPNAANYEEVLTIRRARGGVDSSIEAVSKLRDVVLIDLEWCVDAASIAIDHAHPDVEGARSIAETMFTAIATVVDE
eukprot:m.15065 g.15065  ORF g.15065 m.15065 type:complete len:455 (-) comp10423_c1_seq1:220-1584(-)